MKLIHLSDLHLGKRVNEVSMIEDQEYILREILRIIDGEKPDAVLIAGDVYDKSVPAAEAVTLFDDFLSSLAGRKLEVLVISGNHDSQERLGFGNRLMKNAGVHLSPVYSGKIEPVRLGDEWGEVCFWMLPYLKPAHVRRFFPENKIESYTEALRTVIEQMKIQKDQRNVLITHQFVCGASTCESEEISVGGTDQVDASLFEDFDYTALGHLHGPQNIISNRIRYCGTPLKYSFSEASHHKSVTVVEMGEKGALSLYTLPLVPKHDLRQIRGKFEELTDPVFYQRQEREDYLHIVLTDEEDIAEATGRLRLIYPNMMKLTYDNTRTRENRLIDGALDVQRKTPLELFQEFYALQNNRPMNEEQTGFVLQLIEEIWEGNA